MHSTNNNACALARLQATPYILCTCPTVAPDARDNNHDGEHIKRNTCCTIEHNDRCLADMHTSTAQPARMIWHVISRQSWRDTLFTGRPAEIDAAEYTQTPTPHDCRDTLVVSCLCCLAKIAQGHAHGAAHTKAQTRIEKKTFTGATAEAIHKRTRARATYNNHLTDTCMYTNACLRARGDTQPRSVRREMFCDAQCRRLCVRFR